MPATRRTADAVVIGTGAGGGPAASVLAEAGLRTVVIEAGSYLRAGDFTGDEGAMTARLWKTALAADSGLAVYAGTCVGGSTVINDALCFRTPPEILAEWRNTHGLSALTDTAFAPFVDRAWADVHASPTEVRNLNKNALRLAEGAKRLGWDASPTPRSVRDCANLGLCNVGCPSNAKQSTLLAYVPRAEAAGALVLADTRVDRIVIHDGRVRGVEATHLDPVTREPAGTCVVEAPIVCVAAGVLATPALLQRSGVPAGEGVQFHSSVHVAARFAEPVHGYFGPTMAYAVHEWSDVNGHRGPGVMIESVTVQPVATASALPGFGAMHADAMATLPYLARSLVVIRDRTRGRIDGDGGLAYPLRAEDLERLRRGMIEATRAYLAAGALEVHLPVHGLPSIRDAAGLAAIEHVDLAPSRFATLYAVHLFGGAAMGRDPQASACDVRGAVWNVRGLYVVDAASLPSNTGVNPQITIIANGLRIATGVVEQGRAS